jgi:hypothetical protein
VTEPAPVPWPTPGPYVDAASDRDLAEMDWACKCGCLPDEHYDALPRSCQVCVIPACDTYRPARDRACERCGGSGAWGDHEHCQECVGRGWQ